jgi:hypothetical protein
MATKRIKTAAAGEYRMPRERGNQAGSRLLHMTWDGQNAHFYGGRWGHHSIVTSDPRRVAAHWAGYCEGNMGRRVRPRIQWTLAEPGAPAGEVVIRWDLTSTDDPAFDHLAWHEVGR